MNTIRVSNSLDPLQAQYFVGPDLGQNCLKMLSRPPDKSVYWKIISFISHPKHILWVLKRTVSTRRFF